MILSGLAILIILNFKNSAVDYQRGFFDAASFLTKNHAFTTFSGELGKTPECAKHAQKKACGAITRKPERKIAHQRSACASNGKHMKYEDPRQYTGGPRDNQAAYIKNTGAKSLNIINTPFLRQTYSAKQRRITGSTD
ncbi:MAG: hypothetical protein WBF84_07070 [Castellaniella sp.]|uniref:hypothetical protein n=1 Tax=Castellaniella sp. TaxID=1955812 RepID=UPI003C767AFC